MEFDNHITLKETGRTVWVSGLAPDAAHRHLWDIFSASSSHVGDAGRGEFWLDYSDLLRTRHLVVELTVPEKGPESADGGATKYGLRFRAGSKLNYLGDVAVMALVLLAFWCLSRLLVPHPPLAAVAGLVLSAVAAAGLVLHAGRNFGRKETDELIEKIRP